MGKEELRAACRAAGISYSKLNNDGMRAALVDKKRADVGLGSLENERVVASPLNLATDEQDDTPVSTAGAGVFANMVTPPAAPAAQAGTVVRDGKKVDPNAPDAQDEDDEEGTPFVWDKKCPLCGAHESSQTWANEGVSCDCHECGKTYSVKTGREVRSGHTRENVNSGYKIEKERAKQNGVTRPSSGTLCGQVWAALDKLRADTGMATAADLPKIAVDNGWNKNNVMCEFYTWRKFNGITGRQTRPEVAKTEASTDAKL